MSPKGKTPKKASKPKKSKYLKRELDPKYANAYDHMSLPEVIKLRGELGRSIELEERATQGGGLRSEVAEANRRELRKQLNAVEERFEALRRKHEGKSYGRPLVEVLFEDEKDGTRLAAFTPQFVRWLNAKNVTDSSGHEHDSGTGQFTGSGGGESTPSRSDVPEKHGKKPHHAVDNSPPTRHTVEGGGEKLQRGTTMHTAKYNESLRGWMGFNTWGLVVMDIHNHIRVFRTEAEAMKAAEKFKRRPRGRKSEQNRI